MERQNKDFIFGIRAIIEAIKAEKEIDKLLIESDLGKSELMAELFALAKEKQIFIQRVPVFKLNKITAKNHQGAIAFLSLKSYSSYENVLQDVFERGEVPLFLILDGITDIRNMGAIARTAECAGVHCLIIPEKNAAPINSDAIKTSAGALHHLPVARVKSLLQAVRYLQDAGLQIIVASEKANKTMYAIDMQTPTAIVMGSEDIGVSNEILREADELTKIELFGKIESLNVSVATGIILYEAIRQRTQIQS